MTQKLDNCRLLIYSHDSFGLGHLRRCRTIAHALVDAYKGLSVLILTGSPIIGQFDFKARVDFIRIPGIIKLHNGNYTSLGLHIDLEDTLALRESIIHHTARVFAPDIFLVDKEPTGLQGEVLSTLKMLKDTPTQIILGLRDVMDDPDLLEVEWEKKEVWPVLKSLYDELWVYGTENMGHPLDGLPQLNGLSEKTFFTGYLERHVPENTNISEFDLPEQPYLLVTPGGGGDGYEMVDWVLRAYEATTLPLYALFVLGPFMDAQQRHEFTQRAEMLEQVNILTFSSNLEYLLSNANAIVAMGGYNTFCEILSFDKPALIIPRSKPRREQLIRATKACDLGLVSMLDPEVDDATHIMVDALLKLPQQLHPSQASGENYLTGLEKLSQRFATAIGTPENTDTPKVLFYVQYLLGIGHVRRSALIVASLIEKGFEVHVVFGGVPVPQIDFKPATVHYLPAIKVANDSFSQLLNKNGSPFSETQKQARCQQLIDIAATVQPNIVLTETYPFGRRQMRFELIPLLEWTQTQSPRPLVASSIRDILQRRKAKREQESLDLVEQFYDRVLVHGDAEFTPLESSFPPATQIASWLGYSGYVCPPSSEFVKERSGIVVSIGGGTIGHALTAAALQLYLDGFASDVEWAIMTGPNMPEHLFKQIQSHAGGRLTVMRMATDFVDRLAKAQVSVSLGGYNTTMDILQTGVPAVVVPFEGIEETEQLDRAQMLADTGRIQLLRYEHVTPATLQQAIEQTMQQQFDMPAINTDGAKQSAELLWQWWQDHD
uniref:Mlr3248 protein n=1 Tax=uncultured Thiotrichaceae bacterium TaxID=298394 RepID=A0A6S6UJY2_9GAMM|nr:MAG: Mlr3248 protein [uncultured Thiotrichaceae bacterium]